MYENEERFDEDTLQDALMELLETASWGGSDEISDTWEGTRISTYQNAGVMTYNKGLVIEMPDGTEFQLTIVQSR